LNATTPDHRPTSPQTGRGNVASCCDSLPADFQRISGSSANFAITEFSEVGMQDLA
jgi:hypothetical protein